MREDKEERADNGEEHHRIEQASPTEEGHVEGGDIEGHGADEHDAETASATANEGKTAENLDSLNHGQVARAVHRADEGGRRGTLSRRGHRDKLEPEVESEDDEHQAE